MGKTRWPSSWPPTIRLRLALASQVALSTFQYAALQDQLNRIKKEMNVANTSQARKAVLAKQQEGIVGPSSSTSGRRNLLLPRL